MSSTGLYCSPAWLYQLQKHEKIFLIAILTAFKYIPITQSRDFGEENRWLPRALINHIQDIEREILPSPDRKKLAFNLITNENIDIVIWLAILSLGKRLGCDTQVRRSKLHVIEERRGGVIRQVYGMALVEYIPAISSQGISHSQGPSTETRFYHWGYVDELRGPHGYRESSERESLRCCRLEPRYFVLPVVRPSPTVEATGKMIRALGNVLVFCLEVAEDDCQKEDAIRKHGNLLEDLRHNAAEILEIDSNNTQPKSWENYVICEWIKHVLLIVKGMVNML